MALESWLWKTTLEIDPNHGGKPAEIEIRPQRLLEFLNRGEPAWCDGEHPDSVALGAAK
jgi:hypothetical protein